MTDDEKFMHRALELARNGLGSVSPNPMVGCVIVKDEKIIGEGWHARYGEGHAEVNAINSIRIPATAENSTVYVTLEPCSHHGKTPPCADLLIRHRVKRVMIASRDPNPIVSGKGIEKLRQAGIEVETGLLGKESGALNKGFLTYHEKGRPYIILKWAQTADGFLARTNGDSKWISNEYSRQLVHRWRSEEDAVLVGVATALHDNPSLTVRDWSGTNPVRIVIDRTLKLPNTLELWKGTTRTICYNHIKDDVHKNVHFVKLPESNFVQTLVKDLAHHKIQSVIVEGGAQILGLFISSNLWDEARVFTSSVTFGEGIESPAIHGTLTASEKIFSDDLKIWTNAQPNDENKTNSNF